MKIVIEAEDRATRNIKAVNKAFHEGAISAKKAAKQIRNVNKALKDTKLAAGSATKGISKFIKGIALGNIAANAATKAMQLLASAVNEVGEAILISAEVEELGNVYQFVGNRAGFAREELEEFVNTLRQNGIEQKAANQVLLRGLQAQLKLSDVVKLGRIAQDAAVIGLTNSSDAHIRLVDAVAKLQPRLLKELGIIVNLNTEYAKYSKSIGKTAKDLTEAEKKQALMNAIFDRGKTIVGAYETAMESTSKRMRSLARHVQDAQVAIGSLFKEEFKLAIQTAENFIKTITVVAKGIRELKDSIIEWLAPADELVKTSEEALDQFQQWNIELDQLIKLLDTSEISIENFRIALSKIGTPPVIKFTKEERQSFALGGEELGRFADATGTVNVALEAQLRKQAEVQKAEEALSKRRKEAIKLANFRAGVEQRLADALGKGIPPVDLKIKVNIEPVVDTVNFKAINAGLAAAAKIRFDMADAAGKLEIKQQEEMNDLLNRLLEDQFGVGELLAEERNAALLALQQKHAGETLAFQEDTGAKLLADLKERKQEEYNITVAGISAIAGLATTIENIFRDQTAMELEQLQERLDNDEIFSRQRRGFSQEQADAREELANKSFATESARKEAERELDAVQFEERLEFDRALAEARFEIQEEANQLTMGQKIQEKLNFVTQTSEQIEALGKFNDMIKKSGGLQKALSTITGGLSDKFGEMKDKMVDAIKVAGAWVIEQAKMIGKGIASAAVTAANWAASKLGPWGAIAAAGVVTIGLAKLIGAFDVAANDAIALRWGRDAGHFFMKGFQEETGSPQFGQTVIGSLRGSTTFDEPVPASVTQNITISAAHMNIDELAESIQLLSVQNGNQFELQEGEEIFR